jgi:hypothetical protein
MKKAADLDPLRSREDFDAPGETWQAIENALRLGNRGIPGGSSLAQVLAQYRGVRNKARLPKISEKKYCNGPKGTTREQAVGHLVNPVQYQQESVRRIRLGGVAKGRIVLLLRTKVATFSPNRGRERVPKAGRLDRILPRN